MTLLLVSKLVRITKHTNMSSVEEHIPVVARFENSLSINTPKKINESLISVTVKYVTNLGWLELFGNWVNRFETLYETN